VNQAEDVWGEASWGTAATITVLFLEKSAEAMVRATQDQGIIALAGMTAFDGQGQRMPVKEKFKEIKFLTDERKFVSQNGLMKLVCSATKPEVERPTVGGRMFFN
jgi:hypothetical protein